MCYEEIITKDYEAVCPFCKNTDFREPGDMPWDENEPEYITCPQCGKHFVLTPPFMILRAGSQKVTKITQRKRKMSGE